METSTRILLIDDDDSITTVIARFLRASGYSDDDLRGWLATVRRIGADWRDAFVFFKHEESGTGPALGARLRALL